MNEQQEKLGVFPFVVGGMSFIPLIGVLFGAIAIIWGLVTKKVGGKKLAFVGASGIAFTVVLYTALFYFGMVQRDGIYDDLRLKLSEDLITSLVQSIEFYKTQNGNYPESLDALSKSLPQSGMVSIFDPSAVSVGGKPVQYHYELADSKHYFLLGLGPDGQPFTPDDVLPKVDIAPNSKIGLIVKGR